MDPNEMLDLVGYDLDKNLEEQPVLGAAGAGNEVLPRNEVGIQGHIDVRTDYQDNDNFLAGVLDGVNHGVEGELQGHLDVGTDYQDNDNFLAGVFDAVNHGVEGELQGHLDVGIDYPDNDNFHVGILNELQDVNHDLYGAHAHVGNEILDENNPARVGHENPIHIVNNDLFIRDWVLWVDRDQTIQWLKEERIRRYTGFSVQNLHLQVYNQNLNSLIDMADHRLIRHYVLDMNHILLTVNQEDPMVRHLGHFNLPKSILHPVFAFFNRIREIGGTDLVWLGEKRLTDTDARPNQSRLNLHSFEYLRNCLSDVEDAHISAGTENNRRNTIDVRVVDKTGYTYVMSFKKEGNGQYALSGPGWKALVRNRKMRQRRPMLKFWCFRIPAEANSLCFAINEDDAGG